MGREPWLRRERRRPAQPARLGQSQRDPGGWEVPELNFSPVWKAARHFPRSRQGRLDTYGSGNFVSARAADSQPTAQFAPGRAEEGSGEERDSGVPEGERQG